MIKNKKFLELIQNANNIAILVPNFSEFSGDARVVEVQTRELANIGKKVTIFTLNDEMSKYEKWKSNRYIGIINLNMPNNSFWQRVYRLIFPIDIIKTIKALKMLKNYQLIISHNYPMNWLAFLAKILWDKKYIYWYHGIPPSKFYLYLHEKIYLWLFIFLTKITTINADLIVSVSKFAKKEFKEYINREEGIVIYNKLNMDRFPKDIPKNDKLRLRKKLGIYNSPLILNVGRVCPQKGAHLLVKAFKLIKKEIPDAKLVIVGKHTYKWYSAKLKKIADDSVIFAGFVPDDELPLYYASCDIYATCSLWETYNIPLLEAQFYNKPVIAFNIGAHPEVINTKFGILVEAGNIEQFAKACIRKLKKLRRGSA